jgi:alpha-galactosidase
MMERYIRELDVRYLRHDYNQNPLAYWNAHDEPGRNGMRQIRHLEGLGEVIDRLRRQHPQVVLEGCASGGRRIDLETIRRFHTTWIGDHTLDPRTVRWNLHGLHHFLPGNYLYVAYSWPMPYQSAEDLTAASLMPFLGGAFGTSGRLDRWSASFRTIAARHFAVHRKLRPLLMEDYYPLTRQVGDDVSWAAWQFHNPRTGEGFVQAFRMDSAQGLRRFPLRALEAAATYEFRDPLGEVVFNTTGAEAASTGIAFRLDRHGSQIWMYTRKVR